MTKLRASRKAACFTESVIREMTRLAHQHGAVNLSQGFPDFPAPEAIKEAAARAIDADVNQYADHLGRARAARRDRPRLSRAGTACRSIPSARSRSAAARPRR